MGRGSCSWDEMERKREKRRKRESEGNVVE
jgi:hypothetical protein